ncbi:MAG: ABC transporter substrate-binding protein [Alphaproteobacteria bacterium]
MTRGGSLRRGAVAAVVIAAALSVAAPPAVSADDILLGGVSPLSQPGDVAGGQEMKWAMEQAVADLNAKGGVLGRNIKLLFYDTQNKPDVCAAVANRLVGEDHVVAVVGEFHSGCALAQIPTYNKAGIPVIFSETYNDKITGGDPDDPNLPPNPPTIFRIAPTSSYYSGFVADWVINGIKAKKVGHLTDTTDYGTGAAEAFKTALGKAGIVPAHVTVELAQPDYGAILSRMATENPGLEVVNMDVSETASAYVTIQNAFDVGLLGKGAICIGNPAMRDSESYWKAVPDGVGCVFQIVGLMTPQFNELAKSLDARARKDLGHEARNYAFEAYDSVFLVADAIARAGTTEKTALVAALESTSIELTQGKYKFPYNSKNPVPAGQPGWLWHQFIYPPLQLLEYTEKGQTSDQAIVVWPADRQTKSGVAFVPLKQ